jgi:hypothetical protein
MVPQGDGLQGDTRRLFTIEYGPTLEEPDRAFVPFAEVSVHDYNIELICI